MRTLALLPLAVALLAPLPALAQVEPPTSQPAELPDAESLFERYVEAVGGRQALENHRNRVLHGIYRIVESGDTQILTLYAARGDKLRAELDAPALGTTIRATNGESAWGTNTTGTAFMLSPAEAADLRDSAVFLGEADYESRYKSYRTAGTNDFDGRTAYRVEFVTKDGLEGSVYFDAETGLMVGRQLKSAPTAGEGTLVLVRDYKEFEGVKLPTLQQQRFGDNQAYAVEIEFRWVDVNVDKLPSFDPPPDTVAAPQPGSEE